jgi:Cdc6-like AAA superfamily ATPase
MTKLTSIEDLSLSPVQREQIRDIYRDSVKKSLEDNDFSDRADKAFF